MFNFNRLLLKKHLLECSLKRFKFTNFGEFKEMRFQRVEPLIRILKSAGTSLRLF